MNINHLQAGVVGILLGLAMGWQLGNVPGLMGDEGSEGHNVYELLEAESITVTGERSYIGPLIDYVRVPFIAWLGYTPLALRAIMWLAAVIGAGLWWSVLRRLFGEDAGLWGVVFLLFSPIFLLYGRLGWAVTLFPLSLAVLVWLAMSGLRYKWVWWGVVAGLSVANHILFLPVLVGLVAALVVYGLFKTSWKNWREQWRPVFWGAVLAIVGFWAGFGMQFVVLQMETEDQGDPETVAAMARERWERLPEASWLYVSGSSYVARYTGEGLAAGWQRVIGSGLLVLVLLGCWRWRREGAWWAVGTGFVVMMIVLMGMIDRFALRYFMMPVLMIWMLAGLGVGGVWQRWMPSVMTRWLAVFAAMVLAGWMVIVVLVPFQRTGGSVADFSLGDRTNSAAALVDHRPLVACLRGQGPVWSENVHIWNRLRYLSHDYVDLAVMPEEQKALAIWEVHYRQEKAPGGVSPGQLCPELRHFRVVSR